MNLNNKINHLQMIQGIITRMGNNSFALKGWSIGVMIGVYAFAGESNNVKTVIVTTIPLLVFWFIDTYYLLLERKYRLLYDFIRTKDEDDIDFSMDFQNVNTRLKDCSKYSFFNILLSKSELPFYAVCIITTLTIYLFKF